MATACKTSGLLTGDQVLATSTGKLLAVSLTGNGALIVWDAAAAADRASGLELWKSGRVDPASSDLSFAVVFPKPVVFANGLSTQTANVGGGVEYVLWYE